MTAPFFHTDAFGSLIAFAAVEIVLLVFCQFHTNTFARTEPSLPNRGVKEKFCLWKFRLLL